MIRSIGLDLVEISRIEAALRHPRFASRILTLRECDLCKTSQKIAGRWAAKEAVAKAVGVSLSWQEVEILNDEAGRPTVTISSKVFDAETQKVHLSITHERGHAAAVAILEDL